MADQLMPFVLEIEAGIEISRNNGYTNLASLTVLLFDWFLTFPLEVSLVWKRQWNTITVFFIITRYLPFVLFPINTRYVFSYDLTASKCRSLYNAIGIVYYLGIIFAQSILTIRTWVIWKRGKFMAYSLFGAYISTAIVLLTLLSFHLKLTVHEAGLSAFSIACNANNDKSSKYLVAAFIVLAGFETVMLLLLVTRAVSDYRFVGYSHFLKTIYGDGLSFYIYLFGLAIVNIVLIFRIPDYMTVLVILEGVFYSIFSCRVILHIRQEINTKDEKVGFVSAGGTTSES
ncbi:hypothetical protein Agabi119p4_4233 [Agaricus bisporus var. burnettii]|uniref:DUF6533 domain-containing protein n=1 Tax=Agaricus bisporus var. burnettii TaxID=192524 RepID=A0A8H7F313_AGABI|nr:hypothetical protein Agabi119p4_4233 [Agaricus bisporus var. burnettii]